MPFKRFLALTATATKKVEGSICEALNIPPACVVRLPSARRNLVTRVTRVAPSGAIRGYKEGEKGSMSKSVHERIHLLARRLKERDSGAAIVYCTLQSTTATVAQGLRQHGISAQCYHAGLSKEKRLETQQWFIDGDHGQNPPVVVGYVVH